MQKPSQRASSRHAPGTIRTCDLCLRRLVGRVAATPCRWRDLACVAGSADAESGTYVLLHRSVCYGLGTFRAQNRCPSLPITFSWTAGALESPWSSVHGSRGGSESPRVSWTLRTTPGLVESRFLAQAAWVVVLKFLWRAESDGTGELLVFCPECWQRESGGPCESPPVDSW